MNKKTDPNQELEHALAVQEKNRRDLDRILWIILPILALLLSAIFANWNILSTIGTAIVLGICFVMVGIKKKSLALTLTIVLIYCLIDNYLSYHMQFNITGLKRQLLSMILFVSLIGLTRFMFERAMMKKDSF
ncbi:hypothetical protein SAMN05421749_10258 [Acinetobacter marinus]|uniref:Uncharacterized protein n=1 Tax=Acinetobacter marinus TaxID=281375 RepID=A0A1G6HBW9_9GAMM|nr:hypothetical protein [Acinetobacter marinus]SDB91588.1 hypothetical protein SAMN05421749_10258 [Acinetobacter marinus]